MGLDWPFEGAFDLMAYYKRNRTVWPIMIEISSKTSLENESNTKDNNFGEISELLKDYLDFFMIKYMINIYKK